MRNVQLFIYLLIQSVLQVSQGFLAAATVDSRLAAALLSEHLNSENHSIKRSSHLSSSSRSNTNPTTETHFGLFQQLKERDIRKQCLKNNTVGDDSLWMTISDILTKLHVHEVREEKQ
ncbi:hypothetical protein P3L10_020220 [Capsicum annuum]